MPDSELGAEGVSGMVSALQGPTTHWGVRSEQTITIQGGLCCGAEPSPARLGRAYQGDFMEM